MQHGHLAQPALISGTVLVMCSRGGRRGHRAAQCSVHPRPWTVARQALGPLCQTHLALALIPVLSCKIMCLIFAGRCYFIWHAVSAPPHQLIAFQPLSAAQIPGAASQALTTKHNTCCSYTLMAGKNPTTAAVAPAYDLIASWPVVTTPCVPAEDGGALQGRASRRQAQQEERAGRA